MAEHGLVAGAFGAALSPIGGAHERLVRAGEAAEADPLEEVREGPTRSSLARLRAVREPWLRVIHDRARQRFPHMFQ